MSTDYAVKLQEVRTIKMKRHFELLTYDRVTEIIIEKCEFDTKPYVWVDEVVELFTRKYGAPDIKLEADHYVPRLSELGFRVYWDTAGRGYCIDLREKHPEPEPTPEPTPEPVATVAVEIPWYKQLTDWLWNNK
jgi:hypothetical protein